LNSIDASIGVESTYSSELTVNSSVYSYTGCGTLDFYYEVLELIVKETGYYSFSSLENLLEIVKYMDLINAFGGIISMKPYK
jgi:hypothetical protein